MTTQERSPAVRLDREVILSAAERITAAEGLPALTMRRIGSELGADPTAVYRHFRNKEELLTELSDRLFATEPELDPGAPWQERLRLAIWHAMRRYRTHLDLGLLLAGQPDTLPSLVRLRERHLALLTEAGLELADAARMTQVLENHAVGCGLFFAVSGWDDCSPDDDLAAYRRAFAMLPPETAPLCREAAPFLFPEPDEVFAEATELLITSVEQMAAARHEEEPAR